MSKRWIAPALVIAVLLRPLTLAAQSSAPGGWRTAWSYEGARGPAHWGALDPDYAMCNAGHEQSPIDIENTTKGQLPAVRFDYKNGPIRIINNGYTAVRLNYPPGNGNFLIVGDQRYELTQFHFHHPSEEHVHGSSYPMAAHLMHAANDGKVVAVTVLLRAGAANATIQRLWDHMPPTPGTEHEIAGVEVDPSRLLPRELGYFMYDGSQTVPPCTEGVTWIVLKSAVEVSAAEIAAFAKLNPHNVRPIQPLNGRVVKESP